MVPRRRRLVFSHSVPPLFPWQKLQLRSLPEVREHRFGVPTQRERSWRDRMETLADRVIRVSERELECLCYVVGVHMVHGLHPFVGELQQLTACDAGEYVRIKMPGRIQRNPTRAHQVSRVQNHGTGFTSPSAVEEELFDYGIQKAAIEQLLLDSTRRG